METVRIELDGDYAVVLKEMSHKTARLIKEESRKYLKPRGKPILLSELQAGSSLLNDMEIDLAVMDQDRIGEIVLLNQVREWSFGAVTQDVLDAIPSAKYDKLAREVDKLYSVAPLASATGAKP